MKTYTPPSCVSALVITAILFAFTFAAQAELGGNWRLRSPKPWADSLTGVVATNTKLVAVGPGSAVLTSTDSGATWSAAQMKRGTGFFNYVSSVAWNGASGGGSMLLASNESGVWTSITGDAWSLVTTDLERPESVGPLIWTGSQWAGIEQVYDNGLNQWFSHLVTSVDGAHWTLVGTVPNLGSNGSINQMIWTGSSFVLGGYHNDTISGFSVGYLLRTTDGSSWDSTDLAGAGDASNITSLAWTGTQVVAVGGDKAYTSPTGVTWTRHDIGTYVYNVVWNGINKLIAIGYGVSATSPDGITWTVNFSVPGSLTPGAAIWTGTQVVNVGDRGSIHTSPNGTTWTQRAPTGPTRDLVSIATNPGGVKIAATSDGQAMRSTDGDTWTQVTNEAFSLINSVVWEGSKFVGVAGEVSALSSADGSSWSSSTSFTGLTMQSVAYSNAMLVAAGGEGTDLSAIATSTDGGVNWTTQSVPGDGWPLKAVTRAGSLWVAVGEAGTILTSPNGTAWTYRNINNPVGSPGTELEFAL